jgi:hypothetical protein
MNYPLMLGCIEAIYETILLFLLRKLFDLMNDHQATSLSFHAGPREGKSWKSNFPLDCPSG